MPTSLRDSSHQNAQETIQSRAVANTHSSIEQHNQTQSIVDQSPEGLEQRRLSEMAQNGKSTNVQRQEAKAGLPDQLKSGIESISGYSMDDVNVHYHSDEPAQLQAHAFGQGTDIHLGKAQKRHLPHEAWHVVQQKQGRVTPTPQFKEKVNVNDDTSLENEADIMGKKAMQLSSTPATGSLAQNITPRFLTIQRVKFASTIDTEQQKFQGDQGHLKFYLETVRPWLVQVQSDHPEVQGIAAKGVEVLDKDTQEPSGTYNSWEGIYKVISKINSEIDIAEMKREGEPELAEDVKFGFELEFFHPKKTEGIRVKDDEDITDMKERGEKVSATYKANFNKKALGEYRSIAQLWQQNRPDIQGVTHQITTEDHKGHGIPYLKITIQKGTINWWYKPTIDDDVLEIIAQPFSVKELDNGLDEIIQSYVFDVAHTLGFQTFKGKEKLEKPLGNHMNVDMTSAFANLGNVTRYMIRGFKEEKNIVAVLATSRGMTYDDPRNASFVTSDLMGTFEDSMEKIASKCDARELGYTVSDPRKWKDDIDELMSTMRTLMSGKGGSQEGAWDEGMNYQHYMALNAEHIGKSPDPSTWRVEMRTSVMPASVDELKQKIGFILKLRDQALKGY